MAAQNARSTYGIEPLPHETIIKGKTIMISPKGKVSYTQNIGETDVDPSRHRERLLQLTQMDEPVLGAPATRLETLWNHLKQHCFSERNIWILQRCHAKVLPDYNSDPTKSFVFINSPSVNLASRFQLIAWRGHSIVHMLLLLWRKPWEMDWTGATETAWSL
jgi:hypothetical protein